MTGDSLKLVPKVILEGTRLTWKTEIAFRLNEHPRIVGPRWLEEGLSRLGFRLVLCTRSEESFPAARARRLAVSGNPAQYDDLSAFVAEQELMRDLAGRSALEKLELDVSDDDLDAATERIADWLAATGGLHARAGLK